MQKYSRLISVSGRSFHTSQTMGDIFLAHVSDITGRSQTELVPLLHEGGVEMLLVGPLTAIVVEDEPALPTDIGGARTDLSAVTAA
jgi:hypothetical protein